MRRKYCVGMRDEKEPKMCSKEKDMQRASEDDTIANALFQNEEVKRETCYNFLMLSTARQRSLALLPQSPPASRVRVSSETSARYFSLTSQMLIRIRS